ncbi:MAG TPA: bifunctional acetate--CoA ligase family protein/GNAT family N-acetyltransferase [Burkholderiales bacterium]
MSIRNLEHLFQPQSVAVIGASDKPRSVGAIVLRNLVEGGFAGSIMPVNPKHDVLAGIKVYPTVGSLPAVPELAIICTPPSIVPDLIGALGARGTKAAIVITAGLGAIKDGQGRTLKEAMLAASKPYLLRILGPNCVGLLIPALALNASFAHTGALAGKIAFVSQSGALVTGVLDWAKSRNIGFSKFISLGDSADVDFGDVLDYLGGDAETHAILLYIESITAARKFMSAARAAARNKPVLVVKAGRVPEAAKAAASHTGALAGSDDVYDAAIRRAGMLRVFSTEDLFDAVETLARARPLIGERLVILTNGGGPGVMATDALVLGQGRLASLSQETLRNLDAILPPTWSHGNPVDIIGDAPTERYAKTLQILLKDPEADAVLFIHAPTAIVPSVEIAAAVSPVATQGGRNVIACWLGGDAVRQARGAFTQAGIPTYDTPEEAVRSFLQVVQYRRNQDLLMEVPPSRSADFAHDREKAQAVVRRALAEGRTMLSEPEAKAVLAAYGIPIVNTQTAATVEEAVRVASNIGFPVALKILSPDVTHKSDVGGVALDLENVEAVDGAAQRMRMRLQQYRPNATLQGFTVQTMVRRPNAHELIVGVTTDRVFGPVILFGAGGTAVEITADRAIGLPPLNMVLAGELISRTRISKLLAGYRDRLPADVTAISRTLIQVSHLIADIPEIVELDINPLLADDQGVLALDARMRVAPSSAAGVDRFAIRPYPEELEEWISWQDRQVLLRPIKPEDGAQHLEFFNALNADDVHYRLFLPLRELRRSQLARLTQIDYDREMAFIATREDEGGHVETLGVARAISDPDNIAAEFAIIVRSDLKGKGLGEILLKKLVDYCNSRGTRELVGEALAENQRLIALARRFGFTVTASRATHIVSLKLELAASRTNLALGSASRSAA